jgi:hypothetical protein
MAALKLGNHLVAPLQPSNGVVHKLVNDSLGRLLLVNDGSALAHEVRSVLVKDVLLIVVFALAGAFCELVKIGFVGNDALGDELLNLCLAVGLPVINVVVVADTHRATCPNDGTDVVIVSGCANGFLVSLGGTGLVSEDEAGSDPDGTSAHHKGGSEELTVVDTTSSDDLDGAAGERGLVLLADVDNSGDEDSSGDITGVATTLTTLGAYDIDTEVKALLDVLDVADHVHVDDTIGMKLVDNSLGRYTNGRDKELGALLDDDIDQLVELTLGIIVTVRPCISA